MVNDYEETGVSARLVWDVSDTMTVDTKLRVSEVSAASIAFNAAFEIPFFVGYLDSFGRMSQDIRQKMGFRMPH